MNASGTTDARRRGFTLLELCITLALAAGLMVAVLGLLALIARRSGTIMRASPDLAWQDRVVRQLRWDLERAKTWELSQAQLTLTGFGAVNPFLPNQQVPMTVIYRAEQAAGRSWLVRSAAEVQPIDNRPPQRMLIAPGLDRFSIVIPLATAPAELLRGPLPRAFELTLTGTDSTESIRFRFVQ